MARHATGGLLAIAVVFAMSACMVSLPGLDPTKPEVLASAGAGATLPGAGGDVSKGPAYGQVLGLDGQPAANVTVTAFAAGVNPLIGNAGSGLAGNAGGGLAGNAGGALAGNAGGGYRIASGITVKTDAAGRFVIGLDEAGKYNVEAVRDTDGTKAWQGSISYAGGGTQAEVPQMKLAPVGQISGSVKAADAAVTDFTGTRAYIPGSSYTA